MPHVQPTSRAVCSSASAMQTRVLGGCGNTLAGSMELLDVQASNHDPCGTTTSPAARAGINLCVCRSLPIPDSSIQF